MVMSKKEATQMVDDTDDTFPHQPYSFFLIYPKQNHQTPARSISTIQI